MSALVCTRIAAIGAPPASAARPPLRIAYFHGGRCHHLYRTFQFDFFKNEGAPVQLYSSFLNDQDRFVPIPRNFRELWKRGKRERLGRTTGTAIVKAMENGALDGGCIGESAFIQGLQGGKALVAVLQLSHDYKDAPGKVLLTRRGFIAKSSKDLIGKTLLTRRAGPGDAAFLKEYLRQEGLVPGKDVKVLEQINDDDQHDWLAEGKVDGGLYHVFGIKKYVEAGDANIFRPMNWINPELSSAILVFNKKTLEERPEDVRRVVNAYAKRLLYELTLSSATKHGDDDREFGMIMDFRWRGLRLPGPSYPPLLKLELLNEMQDLLIRNGAFDKAVDLSAAIDQRYLEQFVKEHPEAPPNPNME